MQTIRYILEDGCEILNLSDGNNVIPRVGEYVSFPHLHNFFRVILINYEFKYSTINIYIKADNNKILINNPNLSC